MGFRLKGLIALTFAYFTNSVAFRMDYIKVVGDTSILFAAKMYTKKNQVFSGISLTAILAGDHP